MKRRHPKALLVVSSALLSLCGWSTLAAEPRQLVEVRRFEAPEAIQGVAVDATSFYAIGDDVIGKYDKQTGEKQKIWKATPELPLTHLDSGAVIDGKLYGAHSNFPHWPEASSVEIWDVKSLEHVGTHSLGIFEGSLTWVDWHDESWWVVFAHYTQKVNDDPAPKDSRWTSVAQFDREWRRVAGWTFPAEVIERFEPHSSSGGSWGPDGRLWCSGHDRPEVYCLELPKAGAELKLINTLTVPIAGQGIAWDRSEPGMFYGIDRSKKQVIVAKLVQ